MVFSHVKVVKVFLKELFRIKKCSSVIETKIVMLSGEIEKSALLVDSLSVALLE